MRGVGGLDDAHRVGFRAGLRFLCMFCSTVWLVRLAESDELYLFEFVLPCVSRST